MGKYEIGTRVRDNDGDEAVIIDKRKGERLVSYGSDWNEIEIWVSKSFITPIPAEIEVGDRVRCTKDCDPGNQFTAGKEYVVRYVGDESIGVVADDGGNPNGWCREFFELVTVWQPKVGDRVRYLANGAAATVRSEDGDSLLIEFDERQEFGHNAYAPHSATLERSDCAWWVGADQIEPLLEAAKAQGAGYAPAGSLLIEAGKFYRTRDGRKVGPMGTGIFFGGRPWLGKVGAISCSYWSNGQEFSNQDTPLDLVAEWVDEPAPISFSKGQRVVLSSPATVSGVDKRSVHLMLDTGGTYTLPAAALVAA